MKKILIFSGTTEGRTLSNMLSEYKTEHYVSVVSDYGIRIQGKTDFAHVRTGRLDYEGMKSWFQELFPDSRHAVVVDATHPYAADATANIRKAAEACGVQRIRIVRNFSETEPERSFFSIEECAAALEKEKGNILLTTGSKELSAYCGVVPEETVQRTFVRVIPSVESLAACEKAGILPGHVIAMQGPFSKALNKEIFRQYGIRHMVTKESGPAGGYQEKTEAASELGLGIWVIRRPETEEGVTVEEAFRLITGCRYDSLKGMIVRLVGAGPGGSGSMSADARKAIEEADMVFGAARLISNLPGKTCPVYRAEDIIPVLEKEKIRKAAVLFSGDVGFYSGAKNMKAALHEWRSDITVELIPGISSLVCLASRIGESYENACFFSLHGRPDEKDDGMLLCQILHHSKTFVLLSGDRDVRRIGGMLEKCGTDAKIAVGKNLSCEDEQVFRLSPAEAAAFTSDGTLAMAVLNDMASKKLLLPGFQDDAFVRDTIPMTKECVRHESIRRLMLREEDTVWDIGGGTGSVAIEIAGLHPSLNVFTIEKKPEACALIRENRDRLGVRNLTVVEGTAPDDISLLERPDAVFIGGTSGKLPEVIAHLASLKRKIRVVVNTVTLETVQQITEMVREYGIRDADCVQLGVTDVVHAGGMHMMKAQNPVMIWSFTLGGSSDDE